MSASVICVIAGIDNLPLLVSPPIQFTTTKIEEKDIRFKSPRKIERTHYNRQHGSREIDQIRPIVGDVSDDGGDGWKD